MPRGLSVAVGVLSLVLLGAVLGIATDRLFFGRSSRAPSVHEAHDEALEHMRSLLSLDDTQVAAIDSILRSRQVTVENVWRSLHQHLHSAMDTVHEDILSLLRPGQRAAFDRWMRGDSTSLEDGR